MVAVSWFEAVKYCEWLSLSTGLSYRLPTEAEWERAARGGVENQLYPWGDAPPQSLPDYEKRWKKGPEPVAQYAPNAFGLYDICENVHEWCSDWYQAELLCDFTRTQSGRSGAGRAAGIARRFLAASRQGQPVRGPLQHPAGISLRRLRISRGV